VTTESPSTSAPSSTATASAGSEVGTSADLAGVTRYRCTACGNLTRFNVVTSRKTKAFHHFSVGGDLNVEDVEVMEESVEEVTCRWCGNGNAIEIIDDEAPEAG
jgi:hypothetical protein